MGAERSRGDRAPEGLAVGRGAALCLPVALVVLALAGCLGEEPTPDFPPPRPTFVRPTPSAIDGVTGVAVDFIARAAYGSPDARTYLSPRYRAQAGDLREALGIRRSPDSFQVGPVVDLGAPSPTPTSLSPPVERRASADITMRYGDRFVRARLTLERTAGRWQIAGIEALR